MDSSEATGESKQVLEYYKLYGRDRDIKQYLALPLTVNLDNAANIRSDHEENIPRTTSIPSDDQNVSRAENDQDPKSGDYTKTSLEEDTKPEQSSNKTSTSKSGSTKVSGKSKNEKRNKQDFVLNVESQIEINYEIDNTQNISEDVKQVKFDKKIFKPKSILKADENLKQKMEMSSNAEMLASPTSSVASNRRLTVSPTSSAASNKRLEWDSLADVGYNNLEDIASKYPLSTLERIALEQRHKSQYQTHDFKAPATSNVVQQDQKIPIVVKSSRMHKFIGKPKAESTPILPKIDSTEDLEMDIKIDDKLEQPKDDMKEINQRKFLKQCKSLNDIHSRLITADKVDKYIQTSLPRDSTLQNTPTLSGSDETDEMVSIDKENIKKTPMKNKYRSRMLRKQRISRRKLASSTPFQIDCESENLEDKTSQEKNALDALKSDSRFNISQSSIGTNMNTISQTGESHGIKAESFEYMAGNAYKQSSGKTPDKDNTSSLATSDASLKRSKKLEDVSNLSSSKSNKSTSSNNIKNPSSTSTNDESSNNCDKLFGDAKFSTLNRDIKTSIRLLNSLVANNKGNIELKKRMVKKFVKRLLEANYADDSSNVDSSVHSKTKESQSSNVIHSTINSSTKSFSTSASPDPSYSLPEHLIANVPWKPSKFSQGIDYIRVPTTQTKDIPMPSTSAPKEIKYKSIYTGPHRVDKKYSSTSASNSMESFKDLGKISTKSPEKINLLNEQQKILEQNLVKQQICSEQIKKFDNSNDVLSYAKQEKEHQLAWINSEIQHLNYLKMVLENQSSKEKKNFDSPKELHKISAGGDAKFDANFFEGLGNIPNRNIVYPIITNLEPNGKDSKEPISIPSSSTHIEEEKIEKENEEIGHSSRSQYDNLVHKSVKLTSISETNTSSTKTKKSSIRDQIKELTRNIELLKQSTQYRKNSSSAHTSQSTYTEWDSHTNTSRRYSEVIHIYDSKSSSQDIQPKDKSTESSIRKSKSSSLKTSMEQLPSTSKDVVDKNGIAKNSASEKSKSIESMHSSGTHTSLKSATISISGQNVLSKSTEQSPSSFTVDPAWEIYLKRKFEKKTELQTISTQTSDQVIHAKKIQIDQIKSCIHCNKCSCKCKKTSERKSKPKKTPKPVAYVLTFENESTPSTSSKHSQKASLDEVRIKLPYNRENKKYSKSRRAKTDINDNRKDRKSRGEKPKNHKNDTEESLDTLESSGLQNGKTDHKIINGKKKSKSRKPLKEESLETPESSELQTDDKKVKSRSASESTIRNNTSASSIGSKCEDSNSQLISKSTNSISTMFSTSTDSFVLEGKPKSAEERAHKPTVQECLILYKSDFVRRAEKRREIINKISELRSQRNEQRKKLLQLISDNKPEHQNEIVNIKKMLPHPPKPPRIFTSKEIRDMSRKKYRKLPEVTQKKKDALRNNLYRNNRFLASIFNKKLQKKTLQGKVTLSQSLTVANGYD